MAVDYSLEPGPNKGPRPNPLWLLLCSQGDHPHGLSLWHDSFAKPTAALEPGAFTSRPPPQTLTTLGVSQCMDSISRLCWLWSLLLRLGNEGHRWEWLWAGCPFTKGSSPMPGHPGTVVHDNMKEKPQGAAPSQVAQTMAVYTGSFTGIQDLSSVLYLGCKTTDIFLVVGLWHTSVFSERKNFSSWLSGGKIQPPEMLNFLKLEPGVKSWQGEFTL